MPVPTFHNVNTLGVSYIQGKTIEHHYEEIFDKIMGIPDSEIEGVDNRGDNRFIFKVTTQERYEDICERFTGRDIFLERGYTIRVDDISTKGTLVEIERVPFDVSNEQLKILLSKYGEVNKCQTYFHKYGKYSSLNKSGHRIAWIDIKSPIPRILNIKETQNYLCITYRDQPFSCNKCGKVGHVGWRCRTKLDDYINVIDAYPTQNKISGASSDNKHSNIDTDDLEIHIESSQSANEFECRKCDYKCAYDHILQEHMLTHTSEGTSKCSNDEIKFNCSKCDFDCLNEDDLNNHMSSHGKFKCKVCNEPFKTNRLLVDHGKIHTEKKLKCTECDYIYSSNDELKKHMKQHTGDKNGSNKKLSSSPEANIPTKKTAVKK